MMAAATTATSSDMENIGFLMHTFFFLSTEFYLILPSSMPI